MEGGIALFKKGFAALEKHVRKCRTALEDRLQHDEVLNDAKDAWLDEIDDDAEPTTRPTRREALSTAVTLQSFVTTLSDTYTCKLDKLLATFGHQTQLEATNAMSDTSITNFFTRTTPIPRRFHQGVWVLRGLTVVTGGLAYDTRTVVPFLMWFYFDGLWWEISSQWEFGLVLDYGIPGVLLVNSAHHPQS
ncbi:hypothetical protein DFH07DRAFT_936550 [Mycena maculata]|uniref:Uncharacterized protein n=1 Tax=Mycena maculata TaxID=230809 RepID=A0AAD7K6P5_9AGAR|nr:hypothetical protein DFH07DRAFT_936550 [Mycena maculata]